MRVEMSEHVGGVEMSMHIGGVEMWEPFERG